MEHTTEQDAAEVINGTIEDAGDQADKEEIIDALEERMGDGKSDIQPEVHEYIEGVRKLSHDAIITELPPGIGGQFDGSDIAIAKETLKVGENGVVETVKQLEETNRHEMYHALNGHTDPLLMPGGSEPDGTKVKSGNVVIDEKEFSETQVIEGLTVAKTGDTFVSEDYKSNAKEFSEALDRAGLGLSDAERAVNEEKDLTRIDDRYRDAAQEKKGVPMEQAA